MRQVCVRWVSVRQVGVCASGGCLCVRCWQRSCRQWPCRQPLLPELSDLECRIGGYDNLRFYEEFYKTIWLEMALLKDWSDVGDWIG